MKNQLGRILVNLLLAGAWALCFAALLYNVIEGGGLHWQLSLYVSLGLVLAVIMQTILSIRRAILSYRNKQYGAMTTYLLLSVILLLIVRMGGWIVSIYLGGGAVGGH